MPYVDKNKRINICKEPTKIDHPGDLNYYITHILMHYMKNKGGLNYTNINEIIGVLECVKNEFYSVVARPYEDVKKKENGDISFIS